jgi:hypothetical protein
MGSRQIVLVSTAGISVLNAGIFWREAKTKRLFSQCKKDKKNYCKTYRAISEAVPPLLAKTSHQLSAEKESFCLYFKWKRVKLFIWVE